MQANFAPSFYWENSSLIDFLYPNLNDLGAKGLDVVMYPWFSHFQLGKHLEHWSVFLLHGTQIKAVSYPQDITETFFA